MRDYQRKPNRFTFKLLFNGEPVTTVDHSGNSRDTERDFDAPFSEPYNLNPFLDSRIKIPGNSTIMDVYQYTNIFENSWEAVELGEEISDIFRLVLRQGTEQYLMNLNKTDRSILMGEVMSIKDSIQGIKTEHDTTQDYLKFKSSLENWAKGKTNEFTFVIIDKRSPVRKPTGYFNDLKELNNQIDVLKEKQKFGNITKEEMTSLKTFEKELSGYYTEREIFRHSISADDFSYSGKEFTPPIAIIWKDFNINFNTPSEEGKAGIEYADISDYQTLTTKSFNFKSRIDQLKAIVSEVEKTGDNIKVASIEADMRKIERELSKVENTYFKGIRTLIKEYLNLEQYENRFLNVRDKNLNFYVNTSEPEIYQESIMI